MAGVGQREHIAVPHHHPDHAVGGLLLGAASGSDRFEVVAAAGDRHGQSRGESGELDRLIRGVRIGEHGFGCRDAFLNLVLVHRHCRCDRIHHQFQARMLDARAHQ